MYTWILNIEIINNHIFSILDNMINTSNKKLCT